MSHMGYQLIADLMLYRRRRISFRLSLSISPISSIAIKYAVILYDSRDILNSVNVIAMPGGRRNFQM